MLESAEDFQEAVHDLIKKNFSDHQRVIFNGNGYSEEWVEEAVRRGLPNIRSMVDAIPELVKEESVSMFEKYGVFTKTELESRVEVKYENYTKTINIEAKTMIDMASKQIVPAVIKYEKSLADAIISLKAAGLEEVSVQRELLDEVCVLLKETQEALDALVEIEAEANAMEEGREQAVFYHDRVMTAMEALRAPVDKLEMIVDKEMWPMPSYGDLIFEV